MNVEKKRKYRTIYMQQYMKNYRYKRKELMKYQLQKQKKEYRLMYKKKYIYYWRKLKQIIKLFEKFRIS